MTLNYNSWLSCDFVKNANSLWSLKVRKRNKSHNQKKEKEKERERERERESKNRIPG